VAPETHRDLIGRPLGDVPTPALLVDAVLLERNLAAMAAHFADSRVVYRPHTKCHRSPLIAKMQLAHGARGVCCSKLGEAEVLVAGGIVDIHITTPVVGTDKTRRLAALAASARMSVVVDNAENVAQLSDATTAAGVVIGAVIEMDVGQGRCGVASVEEALALAAVVVAANGLTLKGMQGYQGKLQSVTRFSDRRKGVRAALDKLLAAAHALEQHGFQIALLTGGGTGSLPIDLASGGLTELQPGSYVFMDSSYRQIDWNADAGRTPFANALSVLAGVVSRPLSDRAVLDVGWKAASSDSGPPVLKEGGYAVEFAGDEHSLVRGEIASTLRVGSRVELIPSHCDTTVNLYDRYHVIRDGAVEAIWPVAARGRTD